MHEDELTRRVVDSLQVEPESPQFFERLHSRLEEGDRAAVRRWRRTAIAFAAAAVAATVAAGVLATAPRAAANVVDRTVACQNLAQGGGDPFFDVQSMPGSPPPGSTGQLPKHLPAGFVPLPAIQLETGGSLVLFLASPYISGYQLDSTHCAAVHKALKLGPRGLPAAGTLDDRAASSHELHQRCAAGKTLMRIRITTDANGIPVTAKLLIVRAATGRPVLYVDWARKRATVYAAATGCVRM